MPIFDTFTKRKRLLEQGVPSLQHEEIPQALRTQVFYVWREHLGAYHEQSRYSSSAEPASNRRWRKMCEIMARERGVFSLSGRQEDPFKQCVHLLLSGTTDDVLEVVEVTLRWLDLVIRDVNPYLIQDERLIHDPDAAISEVNARFKEHGVGYRYANGQMVQLDSELLHAEVTAPALTLLHEQGFEGPLQEFMDAHRHNRRGEAKDANVDALNALESTIKAICDKRGWKYPPAASGAGLVQVVIDKGLIPAELTGHFDNLLKAMKAGLPPVRHNFGGHGQGAEVKVVGDHLSAYALHLMASAIVLLIEAHKTMP